MLLSLVGYKCHCPRQPGGCWRQLWNPTALFLVRGEKLHFQHFGISQCFNKSKGRSWLLQGAARGGDLELLQG